MPTKENQAEGQQGLVVSYHGSTVTVKASNGQVYQCHLRRNQALPVVGDQVIWQLEKDNTGLVMEILPRRTVLTRGDMHGNSKPLAANLDAIAIVMSPPPIFSEHLVDRYLVAAELLKIPAIIVLNKIDLIDDAARLEVEARLQPYRQIPYPVVLSSICTPDGLHGLIDALKHKCAVLVGPSGVGKSSIISALSHEKGIQIGDVTAKGIGRHTTTSTRLYSLPEGVSLIDSPGVREFSLWSITKQDILIGFPEFREFLGGCKFRDCLHVIEPGCIVRRAVDDGKISPVRYANYQTLIKKAASN